MHKHQPGNQDHELPGASRLSEHVLEALRELGGSGANEEIEQRVAEHVGLTKEQLAAPHDPWVPGRTEYCYRMAWARTRLRQKGLIKRLGPRRWGIVMPPSP
jgi:hypothetical protein